MRARRFAEAGGAAGGRALFSATPATILWAATREVRAIVYYILRRLLYFIPTLIAIYTVAFLLIHAAPGSPFAQEKNLPPEVLAT
jgi:hypothetical protein